MATKYSTAHFEAAESGKLGPYRVTHYSSKARALAAALSLPGLVRVQTPAGNLVTYVDNRKGN
jgi:hypothetical protein